MKKDVFTGKELNIHTRLVYIEAGILTILVVHIVALIMLMVWGY